MLVEYVWLDANQQPRSKTRVIHEKMSKENLEIPVWNFDGSSTGQAEGKNSEILLKPCAAFPDPFRGGDCIMALCETFYSDMTPHKTNTRSAAVKIFEKYADAEPLFGIEQEFFLERKGKILAFDLEDDKKPSPQGDYYCGNGENAIGRAFIDAAFKRCIMAGLKVTGYNAEVAPSQWEIQICAEGINAADQITMMRYILNRTGELHGLSINLHPKPLEGDWNGSGCHVNFSTKSMREVNGYADIMNCIDNLEAKHTEHMKHYGADNDKRMTGNHETSSFDTFTSGVADRTASVRIPQTVHKAKFGYLEDRRPASNMDPYVVTSMLLETCYAK